MKTKHQIPNKKQINNDQDSKLLRFSGRSRKLVSLGLNGPQLPFGD
jgi:hypothetical protein